MPCYHPITGYQQHGGGRLSFNKNEKDNNTIQIPCGQCIGCRLRISREWATRCVHEKQMHKYNCTITLTYDERHLPDQSSLNYTDFQLFMKRLRQICLARGSRFAMRNNLLLTTSRDYVKLQTSEQEVRHGVMTAPKVRTETEQILNLRTLKGKSEEGPGSSPGPSHYRIRFYMGAEYGEQNGRPHYHACLFGIDFADKKYNRTTPAGFKIYTSPTLDKLWGKGFASIGELTFESAAYIARYIMKKQTGDKKTSYEITDAQTGEIQIRKKEFNQMSRKPGIGSRWLEKYHADVYPHGKVIIRGHQAPTPRYYDKIQKLQQPLDYEQLQYDRLQESLKQIEHHTDERLAVQEQVQKAKIRSLKRNKA